MVGETVAEDAVVIRADVRARTVDHDGDTAGGGADGADDGGETGAEAGRLNRQQAALEFEGRGVGAECERRIEGDRTRTQDEARLRVLVGLDVTATAAHGVLTEREVGRAALDDLNRAGAVEEITRVGGSVTADHDQRTGRGRGVGDDAGGAGAARAEQGTDLDRATIEVEDGRVVEGDVD